MQRIFTGVALAGTLVAASLGSASAQVYYGYGLPPGSYQQSCTNININGSTLSASCTNGAGQRIYSSIDLNRCGGAPIRNNNGYLVCGNGYGYNNNVYGAPRYGGTDRDDNRGHHYGWRHRKHHREDNDADENGGYNNSYGYGNTPYGYGNSPYGYSYGLPPGSYQASCRNERMNGATLSASCTNSGGQWVYSSIYVPYCAQRGAGIRNQNGYLRC